MIDSRIKLTILQDDNTVFTDHSNDAADFTRDDFTFSLSSTEDYLYIGFRKPINAVYMEFTTPNTNANTLQVERFDEDTSTFVSLEVHDETKGFIRNGYITWDRAVLDETEVNSITKFYIRIRPSVDHSATTYRGISIVFSDDNQLKQKFFEIDNEGLLPPGETTHIMSHISARDDIIERLRHIGYIKTIPGVSSDTSLQHENIVPWDLLDVFEVREAATYLALSKIFFNLSDSPDDTWFQKSREYDNKYEQMMQPDRLSIDLNDDGFDKNEKLRKYESVRWTR